MSKQMPAQLISMILHPFSAFLFGTMVLASTLDVTEQIGGLIFLGLGGMLPMAAAIYEFYNTRANRAITRVERNEVYVSALISFAFLVSLFATETYRSNYWMILSMATAVYFGLTLVVNYIFDKASQHMGVFSFWVMLLVDRIDAAYGLLLALLVLIAWSRLELKAHTWPQLLWGLAIGLLSGIITWVF